MRQNQQFFVLLTCLVKLRILLNTDGGMEITKDQLILLMLVAIYNDGKNLSLCISGNILPDELHFFHYEGSFWCYLIVSDHALQFTCVPV